MSDQGRFEPQRADLLLIRKGDGSVDDAGAFFRLWKLMGPVGLVEYKSRSRPARSGVWSQLLGYAHLYARSGRDEIRALRNLSLFLLVHETTPTLRKDAAWLGLEIGAAEGAYTPVTGATLFPTWIVTLNALADEEGEPLIGELRSRTVREEDRASLRWLAHFYLANEDRARNLEGFEELKERFMKSPSFLEMTKERYAEGQLEGELKGERTVLLRQLKRRFGEVPEAVEARIRAADSDQLLRWTDRVLDASTLDAVFAKDS